MKCRLREEQKKYSRPRGQRKHDVNISSWKLIVCIRESKGVVVLSIVIARKVGRAIPSRALLSYITGKRKWSTSALIGFAFCEGDSGLITLWRISWKWTNLFYEKLQNYYYFLNLGIGMATYSLLTRKKLKSERENHSYNWCQNLI